MFHFKSLFNELRDEEKNELYNVIQSFISGKIEKSSKSETASVDEREKFVENIIEEFSTEEEQTMPWCCGFGKKTMFSDSNYAKQSFRPWKYYKEKNEFYPWEIMKKWFKIGRAHV